MTGRPFLQACNPRARISHVGAIHESPLRGIEQVRCLGIQHFGKNEQGGLNVGNWLQGKRAIVIGERDGVQGPAIAKCLKAAGAEVIFLVTECFV